MNEIVIQGSGSSPTKLRAWLRPPQNWLRVRLTGAVGNSSIAGAKILLTERSQPEMLLWFEQVTILDSQGAHSYYSLAPTERHLGLGRHGEAPAITKGRTAFVRPGVVFWDETQNA
ncbi:MAG: hypothetical protein E6L09_10790 [Verrucomicrobia bacterium]|nr:MAG: hypothetical protein E6L09_10790 [Verrucomicrobiota bacterium]